MEDLQLKCVECKKPFVFSVGEQKFYEDHKFTKPKRCLDCRHKRKNEKEDRKVDHLDDEEYW